MLLLSHVIRKLGAVHLIVQDKSPPMSDAFRHFPLQFFSVRRILKGARPSPREKATACHHQSMATHLIIWGVPNHLISLETSAATKRCLRSPMGGKGRPLPVAKSPRSLQLPLGRVPQPPLLATFDALGGVTDCDSHPCGYFTRLRRALHVWLYNAVLVRPYTLGTTDATTLLDLLPFAHTNDVGSAEGG